MRASLVAMSLIFDLTSGPRGLPAIAWVREQNEHTSLLVGIPQYLQRPMGLSDLG